MGKSAENILNKSSKSLSPEIRHLNIMDLMTGCTEKDIASFPVIFLPKKCNLSPGIRKH